MASRDPPPHSSSSRYDDRRAGYGATRGEGGYGGVGGREPVPYRRRSRSPPGGGAPYQDRDRADKGGQGHRGSYGKGEYRGGASDRDRNSGRGPSYDNRDRFDDRRDYRSSGGGGFGDRDRGRYPPTSGSSRDRSPPSRGGYDGRDRDYDRGGRSLSPVSAARLKGDSKPMTPPAYVSEARLKGDSKPPPSALRQGGRSGATTSPAPDQHETPPDGQIEGVDGEWVEDDYDDALEDGEEDEMAKMMGFGGFGTSKGKHVASNASGDVIIKKQRTWRQYMNRKGGFNRPLDKIK